MNASISYFSSYQTMPQPRHIAIVLDGNGRWAQRQHLPRVAGHKRGIMVVRKIAADCVKRKIANLTLFAFSSENWNRPADEISVLKRLFILLLKREVRHMHSHGIRLKIAGDVSSFGQNVIDLVARAEAHTKNNASMTLTIAVNYGGRWDIVQATKKMVQQALETGQAPQIDEQTFSRYLALGDAPDPDLLIRTGGEQRISNFLLWQSAYTEFYFTQTCWPDFDEIALEQAIHSYSCRERRYGKIPVTNSSPSASKDNYSTARSTDKIIQLNSLI